MKWHEFYKGFIVDDGSEDIADDGSENLELENGGSVSYFLQKLAYEHTMQFLIFIDEEEDQYGQFDKFIFWKEKLKVKISKIETCETESLRITFGTMGEILPPGMIHGIYTLDFFEGLNCRELPASMFNNKEVDKYLVKSDEELDAEETNSIKDLLKKT